MLLVLLPLGTAVQAQDAKAGDVAAGHNKAAMCIGCHGIKGYQASFPEVHKVPMISGQNAKYIASALGAYRKGDRKHPTMRAIAGSLTDQDIGDLAAFYEQDGGKTESAAAAPAPSADVAELLKKGACTTCHGENLSKPIDPSYPKLAGQFGDYLYVALKAYKTEKNPNVGRAHPVMVAQVQQFKPAELKALANYVATMPSELKTVPQSRFK
ncbi:MAG TPA: c-type cytochrome [Burkholderiaceae bacterium]|nr:c-type cytochrome [Burkholderiaceae bacterium]